MVDRTQGNQGNTVKVGFVIAMIRGILVMILGVVLVFSPYQSRSFLFSAMGLFWLTSGIVLIRHTHPVFSQREESVLGRRTAVLMGAVGILAGLLVIARSLMARVLPEIAVVTLLGAVILLTGLLHLIGEYRIGRALKTKRTTGQKILAVFEIILGVLLIISPLGRSPIVYWGATVWALVGGISIIGDALYKRAQDRIEQQGQGRAA